MTLLATIRSICPPIDWDAFQERVDAICYRLRNEVPHGSVAWGATSKLVTLLHVADIADRIDYCVDNTPEKEGKYLPGTDIRIKKDFMPTIGGEIHHPKSVLLGAWNYESVFREHYPTLKYVNPYG